MFISDFILLVSLYAIGPHVKPDPSSCHGFTHFTLELTVQRGAWSGEDAPAGSVWVLPEAFGDYALPTLMKKVAAVLPA